MELSGEMRGIGIDTMVQLGRADVKREFEG